MPTRPTLSLSLGLLLAACSGAGGSSGGAGGTAGSGGGGGAGSGGAGGDAGGGGDAGSAGSGGSGAAVSDAAQTLALAIDHACAIAVGGAGYCWGSNSGSQVGAGTPAPADTMEPTPIDGGGLWTAVVAGREHSCGLDAAGLAYCWGTGWSGELGNDTTGVVASPVAVSGDTRFVRLSAGSNHTCGLTADGHAYCWGHNADGQFGDGTNDGSDVPTPAGGSLTFTVFDTARRSSCGIASDGKTYCWGGAAGDMDPPAELPGGHRFVALSLGDDHGCAIDTDGAAWCWGSTVNSASLGDGSGLDSETPVPVAGGHTWTWISSTMFSCGVVTGGDAYCWGSNFRGQLGNGDLNAVPSSDVPVLVTGGHPFAIVTTGQDFACGITTTGDGYCWGENEAGQLGNGDNAPLANDTPMAVTGALQLAVD